MRIKQLIFLFLVFFTFLPPAFGEEITMAEYNKRLSEIQTELLRKEKLISFSKEYLEMKDGYEKGLKSLDPNDRDAYIAHMEKYSDMGLSSISCGSLACNHFR